MIYPHEGRRNVMCKENHALEFNAVLFSENETFANRCSWWRRSWFVCWIRMSRHLSREKKTVQKSRIKRRIWFRVTSYTRCFFVTTPFRAVVAWVEPVIVCHDARPSKDELLTSICRRIVEEFLVIRVTEPRTWTNVTDVRHRRRCFDWKTIRARF